jgi:hypothetical protein
MSINQSLWATKYPLQNCKGSYFHNLILKKKFHLSFQFILIFPQLTNDWSSAKETLLSDFMSCLMLLSTYVKENLINYSNRLWLKFSIHCKWIWNLISREINMLPWYETEKSLKIQSWGYIWDILCSKYKWWKILFSNFLIEKQREMITRSNGTRLNH